MLVFLGLWMLWGWEVRFAVVKVSGCGAFFRPHKSAVNNQPGKWAWKEQLFVWYLQRFVDSEGKKGEWCLWSEGEWVDLFLVEQRTVDICCWKLRDSFQPCSKRL